MYYEDTCPCILIFGRYILVLTILQRGLQAGTGPLLLPSLLVNVQGFHQPGPEPV